GDQHRLPEEVVKDRIQRAEYTYHQTGHDEECRHVLRHALLDHFPAGDDDDEGGEAGQQDQRHRDAIDTEVVIDIEGWNPLEALLELEAAIAVIESRIQRQRYQE